MDRISAVAFVPALLLVGPDSSIIALVLAWVRGTAVAAFVGSFRRRTRPPARISSAGGSPLVATFAPRYIAENVGDSGTSQLHSYGLGVIFGSRGESARSVVAELLLARFLAVHIGPASCS